MQSPGRISEWIFTEKENGKFQPRCTMVSSNFLQQESSECRNERQKYETLLITHQDNITTIAMNRPKKKNAISSKMFEELYLALDDASADDSVLTVLTGFGDYFSSGNDLSNSTKNPKDNTILSLRSFVGKFIDFPKPLIAVVNGPAIGIGMTILGLMDLVYASDRATFRTPFTKLGLCPEACSSYTFPKIMGFAKAAEVLLFNKILTAQEACNLGLVTEVFPDQTFKQEVWKRLKEYAKLPKNSLATSKQLMRGAEKEKLHAICDEESRCILERRDSEEAKNAVIQFFKNKAKL
ncbi:hypothetical protein GDO86_011286 [Hymenochirus boettgeri]|uniref:Enoyl-CoA delta isomerase 2, mitochondrial n=1 Tax=Hymenochirus boettgeri TaxID=247094 RepID=A0A8T2JDP5_9PIPI|nr:hypothetical protein GDO86_011286 [Hymenochirus boettgeri]